MVPKNFQFLFSSLAPFPKFFSSPSREPHNSDVQIQASASTFSQFSVPNNFPVVTVRLEFYFSSPGTISHAWNFSIASRSLHLEFPSFHLHSSIGSFYKWCGIFLSILRVINNESEEMIEDGQDG